MSLHMKFASQPDHTMRGCCFSERSCESLLTCLRQYLDEIGARLERSFPRYIVQQAVEIAENAAIDAICDGTAAGMSDLARRRWLYVIAYRQAATVLRRRRPSSALSDTLRSRASLPDSRRAEILAAVALLPDEDRAAVEMIYFGGTSIRSAAALCNVGEATMRRRHSRALKALRRQLRHLE